LALKRPRPKQRSAAAAEARPGGPPHDAQQKRAHSGEKSIGVGDGAAAGIRRPVRNSRWERGHGAPEGGAGYRLRGGAGSSRGPPRQGFFQCFVDFTLADRAMVLLGAGGWDRLAEADFGAPGPAISSHCRFVGGVEEGICPSSSGQGGR